MHSYPTLGRFVQARWGVSNLSRIPIAIALVVMCAAITSASDSAPINANLRNDASLADVHFADSKYGWAVGDRGVIWHTADGGTTWTQQISNVTCRLTSVCFVNRHRGWIVGGENQPYARSTRGVILRTVDGGTSWAPVPGVILPLLTRVKFFDESTGVAIGYGTSSQPSGVFVTRDSGQTWQPLPTDQSGAWLCGDFLDTNIGAVAGASGRYATIARHQVVHSPLATPSLRSFRAMRLVGPAGGWIVGDGGMVMSTSDGGRSWQSPAADLPSAAADHFDFHAIAVHDNQIWIAGTPGTRIFRSLDAGQSWQAVSTGHAAPIRSLAFVDAQQGWAVGDLGCILATQDGGSTWRVQREGGRRTALLGVFVDANEVPLELIAQVGAAEGYIAAVNLIHGAGEVSANDDLSAKSAATQAMQQAGAAATGSAWQFPLPAEKLAYTADDLLAALNRSTDGQALELLERHLVRQLRMWRPNIVVTRHVDAPTSGGWGRASASPQKVEAGATLSSGGANPAASLLEQSLLRAITAAADPTQYVELTSGGGLEPWQVSKVYGVLPAGFHGDEHIETSRFSSALSATPADFTAFSRRLLSSRYVSAPDTIELKLLTSNVAESSSHAGIFSGIALSYGSDARRAAPELNADDDDVLRRMSARRRQLQHLLERTEGNAAWAGQVAKVTEGMDAIGGGELLLQLADGYRATGNLDLAADTYYLFARQYPQHPLVDSALVWLVQFYASGEAAQRAGASRPVNVDTRILDGGATGDDEFESHSPGNESLGSADNVRHTSAQVIVPNSTPAVGLSHDDRLRRAVQLTEFFRTVRPHLYAEPAVRFAEVTAQRQLGFPNEAKRYFLSLRQLPETNPWRGCAAAEDWLANPGDIPPPKPIAACQRTNTRPHLDGRLDESFWQTADILRLSGEEMPTIASAEAREAGEGGNSSPTGRVHPIRGEVRVAYDDSYLYLAVRCPKIAQVAYPSDERARTRDADLSQYDRVEIELDLDRDFSTSYALTIDSRGWTCDACWGDANWNPAWYIARTYDETSWTVEASVPLAQLTTTSPTARHVWAVSTRRTIPRVGYESWAGAPTAEDSPDRFGLLIFE